MTEKSFILDIDYYLEEGRVVFTCQYLKNKGVCCGTGCTHCIYDPIHQKGSVALQREWLWAKPAEETIYKKTHDTTADTSECKKPDK